MQAAKLKESTDRVFVGRQSIAEKYKRNYSIAKKPEADEDVTESKDLVKDIVDDDTDILEPQKNLDAAILAQSIEKETKNE